MLFLSKVCTWFIFCFCVRNDDPCHNCNLPIAKYYQTSYSERDGVEGCEMEDKVLCNVFCYSENISVQQKGQSPLLVLFVYLSARCTEDEFVN